MFSRYHLQTQLSHLYTHQLLLLHQTFHFSLSTKMVKRTKPALHPSTPSPPPSTTTTQAPVPTTLSAIRQDADLWYRIHVLIYDLSNVILDPTSEKRISATTHELYISEPYFLDSEATAIRTALVDIHSAINKTENEEEREQEQEQEATAAAAAADDNNPDPNLSALPKDNMTVEEAIHHYLTDFFDKRKASGDARPCGPHDMVPIYGKVFGIRKEEVKEERFLSRLRRSGLGDLEGRKVGMAEKEKGKGKEKEKGKGKEKGEGEREGRKGKKG